MGRYIKRLVEEIFFQNMSRKENCLDNSVMKNIFCL